MHDVDVVSSLLKQQTVGVALFGVPVTEIGVAAVSHEVTAPAHLNFADEPGVDDLFHREHHGEVTHVVAHEKFASRAHGGLEDPVAALDGDGHGLFQIDGLARLEGGDGHFFVEIVRGGDDDGPDGFDLQQIPVVGEGLGIGEFFLEMLLCGRVDIRTGDDLDTLFGTVSFESVNAAAPRGDQPDLQFFHENSLSFFALNASNARRDLI